MALITSEISKDASKNYTLVFIRKSNFWDELECSLGEHFVWETILSHRAVVSVSPLVCQSCQGRNGRIAFTTCLRNSQNVLASSGNSGAVLMFKH